MHYAEGRPAASCHVLEVVAQRVARCASNSYQRNHSGTVVVTEKVSSLSGLADSTRDLTSARQVSMSAGPPPQITMSAIKGGGCMVASAARPHQTTPYGNRKTRWGSSAWCFRKGGWETGTHMLGSGARSVCRRPGFVPRRCTAHPLRCP